MDFSTLVLIEKDRDTGLIKNRLGSYNAVDGAQYIRKMYYDGNCVNVYFNTNKDVEDWQYYAIFDMFEKYKFNENNFEIEEVEDEYNPTWIVKFDYNNDHNLMENRLNTLCNLINTCINKVFNDIEDKRQEYED
ncbi:hypothetical protein KM800_13275 [Clostridium tyrobutyricum]|uniref:DUF6762 family protein n=1 Tax=Clostridium tyrobutyricum TaxID=1519 RepID=UPI001C3867D4|nr:DUF6762 family protein [Clostridium tyrobutyricum]MBV4420276.1 hypothetical protein [Clostridium tyrobutyricum]